jgi:hypothetical protein
MKHYLIIGVLCLGLAGVAYLRGLGEGPSDPSAFVSPSTADLGAGTSNTDDDGSVPQAAMRMSSASSAGGVGRPGPVPQTEDDEPGVPVWHELSQLDASQDSALSRSVTIRDFLRRWSDAYTRVHARSDGRRASDLDALDRAELERIARLREDGGREAELALVQLLRDSNSALELALISEVLESLTPGYYREEIVKAARKTLEEVISDDDPASEPYMAPVFDLLQRHGDERVVASLESVPERWQPYATVALAKMPEGQGVPSLVDAVRSAGALRTLGGQQALRMLAQVSLEDDRAYEVLVDKARTDTIPGHLWSRIAAVLAGDEQGQIAPPAGDASLDAYAEFSTTSPYSTQTFFSGDGVRQVLYLVHQSSSLSDAEITARLQLIDYLSEQTRNPRAITALERAREDLRLRAH